MAKEAIIRQDTADYNAAVQTIKEAILRSQYKAAKLVNREMLSLYYGIGRYISANSREGFWGTGAIKTISERLRKELPGLKGFSQTNLKYMRIFYEEWSPIIEAKNPKSSATADDLVEILNTSMFCGYYQRVTNCCFQLGNNAVTPEVFYWHFPECIGMRRMVG